ncbi:hypothetical protein D3C87_210180 [compost metagenome]
MQDNLHFFELEIYEIIREDCVRFLRKSTKENLALHNTAGWFRFNKKQQHKLLDLPFFMHVEGVNIRPNLKPQLTIYSPTIFYSSMFILKTIKNQIPPYRR